MAITLITGAPGAGKTAALVDLLRGISEDRLLYVQGLNGLKIPHTPVDASRWHEILPDGAVLVIDEVQQVWRPRGPSQKPTPDIMALETHRHRGIDIFLTTQKPSLCDANVRGLVGRHVHLRDTGWLGRWWYEWPECSDNLAWKSCSIKKRYKLPKEAFSLYKSASLHIKTIRRGSPMLIVAILVFIVLAFLIFWIVKRISSYTDEKPTESIQQSAKPGQQPGMVERSGPLTAAQMIVDRVPRIAGEPDSAPVYDHLRNVVAMPRVSGGFCIGNDCRCSTQQGTDAGLTQAQCRAWVTRRPFDPYVEDEKPAPKRDPKTMEARRDQKPIEPTGG